MIGKSITIIPGKNITHDRKNTTHHEQKHNISMNKFIFGISFGETYIKLRKKIGLIRNYSPQYTVALVRLVHHHAHTKGEEHVQELKH